MDIDRFTSLPDDVLERLYQEPEPIVSTTFGDFLLLPVNEEYAKRQAERGERNYGASTTIIDDETIKSREELGDQVQQLIISSSIINDSSGNKIDETRESE